MRRFFIVASACAVLTFASANVFSSNVLVPQQKEPMPDASSSGTLPNLGLTASKKSYSNSKTELMDPAAELRQKKIQRLIKKDKTKNKEPSPTGGPAD